MLITALEERIPESKVWQSLKARGMTQDKLIKEMKRKSLFTMGKSSKSNKDYEQAVFYFQGALGLIMNDEDKEKDIKYLTQLIVSTKKQLKIEKNKEKSFYANAFKGSKAEYKSKDSSNIDNPPPSVDNLTPFSTPSVQVKEVATFQKVEKQNIQLTSNDSEDIVKIISEANKIIQGNSCDDDDDDDEVDSSNKDKKESNDIFYNVILGLGVLGLIGTASLLVMKSRQR
jgi:predicted ATPase